MTKNLIPEIAKMLGVKVDEEFEVFYPTTCLTGGANRGKYKFTDNHGLVKEVDSSSGKTWAKDMLMFDILCTKEDAKDVNIIKLPWKPRAGEKHWSFVVRRNCAAPDKITWSVAPSIWLEHPIDWALLDKGWVFRTRKEAEAALPKVAQELGVDYEL